MMYMHMFQKEINVLNESNKVPVIYLIQTNLLHKSVGSCWDFHGLSCIILSLPGAGQPALPVDEAGAGCCTVVSSLTMGEV